MRGRGIGVCERWKEYANFVADMGERPGREWTIHRIDNDRGYGPGNCKWATQKEQMAPFKVVHPHGLSPHRYERKLVRNKRYRERHPEKWRAYKVRYRIQKILAAFGDPGWSFPERYLLLGAAA
jgi:hypothetical protein